jgi:hypothetical protein
LLTLRGFDGLGGSEEVASGATAAERRGPPEGFFVNRDDEADGAVALAEVGALTLDFATARLVGAALLAALAAGFFAGFFAGLFFVGDLARVLGIGASSRKPVRNTNRRGMAHGSGRKKGRHPSGRRPRGGLDEARPGDSHGRACQGDGDGWMKTLTAARISRRYR